MKYLPIFAITLILILGFIKISSTYAQSPQDEQIPSDLALDLDLANKNPAPNQKIIADVQTEKAQITTNTGEKLDLPIKEAIPEEIKTQSPKDAVNPDQTTSEQVVEKKETNPSEPNNQNNNKDNGNVQNNIPGTNIAEPDDNAAPKPESSSSPTDTSAPSTSAPAEQSNPIPLENGVAPTPAPDSTTPTPAPEAPAVQGVSTGPIVSWFRQLINKLLK